MTLSKRRFKFLISVFLAVVFSFQNVVSFIPSAAAESTKTYTAQDVKSLMSKLNDPTISEANKKRIAAVVFVNQDVYREAVIRGVPGIPAKDADVDAFLKYKTELQTDVLQRMNINQRNQNGKGLTGPVIPFPYNNIHSDDDIVLGSGKSGKKMEPLYNEALNEVIKERAGRPMTAADRARIDVNGLAWDMTQKGGLDNFFHHEKYINPQSGFANQVKLQGAGDKLAVYSFDPSSGMLVKMPPAEAKASLGQLATDKPLSIPGIEDLGAGTGAMSDYARMADIHQVKFTGNLEPKDVAAFIRNQKYTDRIVADFKNIAEKGNPQLAGEMQDFIETSKKIRGQTNALEVAKILQDAYKIPIVDASGNIDWKKLGEVMQMHQTKQLTVTVPKMMGAVAQNEAVKMTAWLKGEPANSAKRRALRKQLAITYAPMGDGQIQSILTDLEATGIAEEEKAWFKSVLENDTHQIREYAKVLEIPIEELAARINMEGPSPRVVEYLENYHEGVQRFSAELTRRPGGGKFREFLKSKTAEALNLDKMIDGSPGEKIFSWSVLLLALTRAYTASQDNTEGMKAMGMAVFEMIPYVSAVLRFSELEFKESFKQLAMDILPPIALAQLAVSVLHYTAKTAINSFTEAVWDGLAREALKDFTKEDFEKTEAGYWRIRNRKESLEYLEEVSPGLGRVQKLASMMEPEVDARMSRNETAKNNEAALYTLQYLESIDIAGIRVHYSQGFSVDDIKKRVWEKGALAEGSEKNVERVAAKIILENMRVRAQVYTEVLESFIDRIENLYNEDEKDKDFDPSALITDAQAALKNLYENAPAIIKNDTAASQELQAEYRKWVQYLKDYDSKGAKEMDVRRHIQQIIDDFKNFIRKLAITTRLRDEMQNLNLRAAIFGGDKSSKETEEVLLDDTFRIGASAKISNSRAGDTWTIFYYTPDPDGGYRLLGTASPRGGAEGGGEGMFVLDDLSSSTWVPVSKKLIEEVFHYEGSYAIIPVIGFGAWSDPLNQVGLAALQNPMDYLDLFDENRVAFAGQEAQFTIRRAKIVLKTPLVAHNDQEVFVEVSLDVPEYAKIYSADVELKLSSEAPGKNPKLDPENIKDISKDLENPSKSKIRSEKDTTDGVYWVEAKAKIKGFKDEVAPYPQKKSFEFSKEKSEEEQAKEALAALRGLVGQMKKLDADAEGLVDAQKKALENLTKHLEEFQNALQEADAELEKLQRLISDLTPKVEQVKSAADELQKLSVITDKAGVSATEARENCQKHVLDLCEARTKLLNAKSDAQKQTLEGLVSRKEASFNNQKTRFESDLQKSKDAAEKAEGFSKSALSIVGGQKDLKSSLQRLDAALNKAEPLGAQLKSESAESDNALPSLESIVGEANGVQAKASSLYAVASSLNEAAEPWNEIQTLNAHIQGQKPVLENLVNEFKGKSSGVDGKIAELEKKKTGVRDDAAALLENLPDDKKINEIKNTAADIQAAYQTVDALSASMDQLEKQSNTCSDKQGSKKPKKPAKPVIEQEDGEGDSRSLCGTQWEGSIYYRGYSSTDKDFRPVNYKMWFTCEGGGVAGRTEEITQIFGQSFQMTARLSNVRVHGDTVQFTKTYNAAPPNTDKVVEYSGTYNSQKDEFSGQWTSAHDSSTFIAKRK